MHDGNASTGWGQPSPAVQTSARPGPEQDSDRPVVPGDVVPGEEASATDGFLNEIGVAMVHAAERERDRITRDLTVQLNAHLEALRRRISDEGWELIRVAETEIDGIHGWSTGEQERVRQETDRRVEARREELERHLSQQDAELEREVAASLDTIRAYRAELEEFVRRLGEEPDPTEIARRASQLPPPPRIDAVARRRGYPPVSLLIAGDGHRGSGTSDRANGDLVGVMDPALPGRIAKSTGEMVGASRPVPVPRSHDGAVERHLSPPTEPYLGPVGGSLVDEPRTERVNSRNWADVALSFMPLILLVAIAAALAYVLISGRAIGLAG
jgi:hypothetical protein